MARSRHRAPRRGPDRFTAFTVTMLLIMFTEPVVRHLVAGDAPTAATSALGMVGFMTVCIAAGLARVHASDDDQHRLNVLGLQAFGAITVALVAHAVWAPTVVGVPVMVALAGVGLMVPAGEAVAIALRSRRPSVGI